jgi:hypothetical protein
MAQTRATSKALGSPLRFIVTLAGYEGTPAEEMPSQDAQQAAPPPPPPTGPKLDPERVKQIGQGISALGLTYKQVDLMLGACGVEGLRAGSGKALRERIDHLTPEQADKIEAELGRRAASDGS